MTTVAASNSAGLTGGGSPAPARAQCSYCHLPMPSQPADGEHEPQYCCYGCRFAAAVTASSGETGQARWLLTRLGVCTFLSMGVMVFTLYLYGQEIYRQTPADASALEHNLTGLMRYLSLIFATPVVLLLGVPIVRNALQQLKDGVCSADILIVVGVTAAYAYSYFSTLSGTGSTYYETACMVLVLVTVGRWLEASTRLHAAQKIRSLDQLLPEDVLLLHRGQQVRTSVSRLSVGDDIVIPAGQRIPADGVVADGRSFVDEQLLTGESTPRMKEAGDVVRGGSIPIDGALTITVTQVGAQTLLERFARLMDAARRSKGRFERLADRIARYFVPATVVLALAGGVSAMVRTTMGEGIMTALAVMLIACPCALGIATPLAVWVALAAASRRGVLFRSTAALETLATVRTFCFDKTGTLTAPQPWVESFEVDPTLACTERQILALAAGLAGRSAHLYSAAVTAFADAQGVAPDKLEDVIVLPGLGMRGMCGQRVVRLGSIAMMTEAGARIGPQLSAFIDSLRPRGLGVLCIAQDNCVGGVFAIAELIRPRVDQLITGLQKLGCDALILTGDQPARADELAGRLKIPVQAGLGPAAKISHLEARKRTGQPIAMVGDGLNDAPALAAADVGIALGCGADLSREHADACLVHDDPAVLPWLVRLARSTTRTIKTNLFWAFAYNVLGIGLALTGQLNPIFAAIAMVASSAFVVGNSMRLARAFSEYRS